MSKIFVAYRGFDRSRVGEIETYLKRDGLCHNFEDDIDEGDRRDEGFDNVFENRLKQKLRRCSALLLLIGDTTHNPSEYLDRELKYAKSQPWDVFGLHLTNTTGGPPPELPDYKHYIEISGYDDFSEVVSIITQHLPCR